MGGRRGDAGGSREDMRGQAAQGRECGGQGRGEEGTGEGGTEGGGRKRKIGDG